LLRSMLPSLWLRKRSR